jgi:hypothetical protein
MVVSGATGDLKLRGLNRRMRIQLRKAIAKFHDQHEVRQCTELDAAALLRTCPAALRCTPKPLLRFPIGGRDHRHAG